MAASSSISTRTRSRTSPRTDGQRRRRSTKRSGRVPKAKPHFAKRLRSTFVSGIVTERVPNRLLTAQEVAERLGVTAAWVYAQARANRIPHLRLGRYRRFIPESVEAWASQQEQGPAR